MLDPRLIFTPRIKPEHTPCWTPDGRIRIGGHVFGIAAEITDCRGWVWSLVTATDGTRDVNEIISEVRRQYPDVPLSDIHEALEQLAEAGHIENVAPPPRDFTTREQQRYQRSIEFYRWVDQTIRTNPWDVQRILRGAKVVQVGLGGTGGSVATALTASGIGHLHCIDSDLVELSNLNRQTLYSEDDLGMPKVDAALARLQRLNSDVTITGEQRRIGSQEECAEAINGYDLMVLTADRPRDIRLYVNRACIETGTPWVDGGYHGPLITVGGYRPGNGPCWECVMTSEHTSPGHAALRGREIIDAMPRIPDHPATSHPVTAVSAGLSAHLIAHVSIAMLTNVIPVTPGTVFSMNLIAPTEPILVNHPRRPDCPTCGIIG